ncbi:ABC transporter permease [Rhodococcus pyridinivorans]|uniref:ABC transporter permease n=1 Tax=Rhodococcus pyridinivorans TaxID=103816 RepID=UPI003CE4C6A5
MTRSVPAIDVRGLRKSFGPTTVLDGVDLRVDTGSVFRPDAHLVEWVAATGVIALFVLAISAVSAALGMLAGNDEAASGFTFLLLFLPYVSSAFVPPETMPGWLRGFAEHQPVTPVIETVRGLLTGTGIGSSAIVAIGWCAAFTAIGLVAATALFRQRTAR